MRRSEMLRKAREAHRAAIRNFKLWGGIASHSRMSQGLVEYLDDASGDFELDTGPICGARRATPVPEDRLVNLYGVPYEAYGEMRDMQRELITEERAEDRVPWQKPARYGADCLVLRSGQQVTAFRAWEHGARKPPERVEIPERWRLGYKPEVVKGYRSHHRTAA